jgi:hypothetical protein
MLSDSQLQEGPNTNEATEKQNKTKYKRLKGCRLINQNIRGENNKKGTFFSFSFIPQHPTRAQGPYNRDAGGNT